MSVSRQNLQMRELLGVVLGVVWGVGAVLEGLGCCIVLDICKCVLLCRGLARDKTFAMRGVEIAAR